MFVTFEGPEGAGKSTALRSVATKLEALGHHVVCTREPGAGAFGQKIRAILLDGDSLCAESEVMLFLADRANHVANLIVPALENGSFVLCDRYIDSTHVYQGYGRGLDKEFLKSANHFATRGLLPDLTLLFNIDPELGLQRIATASDGRDNNRIDREPLEFHQKIRDGFLELARLEPERFRILEASVQPEILADIALNAILQALSG